MGIAAPSGNGQPGSSRFQYTQRNMRLPMWLMEKLDIPPVGEFLAMIHDAGCGIYACKATVDMFHLQAKDFTEEVDGIISVGQFYEKAAGGQILFT